MSSTDKPSRNETEVALLREINTRSEKKKMRARSQHDSLTEVEDLIILTVSAAVMQFMYNQHSNLHQMSSNFGRTFPFKRQCYRHNVQADRCTRCFNNFYMTNDLMNLGAAKSGTVPVNGSGIVNRRRNV